MLAEGLLLAGALYLGLGVLVAMWLHIRGLGKLDPAAQKGRLSFRLIVTPGLVLLWPIFLSKSLAANSSP